MYTKAYKAVEEISDLDELILKLSDYWSFFDYEILTFIINKCQCTNIAADLRNYEDRFKSYCQRRLCEVPKGTIKIKAKDRHRFYLKCDENFSYNKSKLWDIKILSDKLSKLLDTKLVLRHIKKGCLELTFTALSDVHFPLSGQQKEELKEIGIVRMYSMSQEYCGHTVQEARYMVC